MRKKKIIFRVDGGRVIGLGHITRCCALADILKDDFEIYFYTRANSQFIIEIIKKYCANIIELDDNITYEEEAALWVSVIKENEIVVLDGYNFNTNYQQRIKEKNCKLVCIDDIHAYHFVADAVINHAPGANNKLYSTESYTNLYLGTDYLLLRKIFLLEAAKPISIYNAKESPILICFGGSDPCNFTKKAIEETIRLFPNKKINIVIGSTYMYQNELKEILNANKQASLHISIEPDQMLHLMQQSNIAITSASTVALEYICVKGNLFLECIADNQKEIYESLIKKKCAYPFALIAEKYNSDDTINHQHVLIDGKSKNRLSKIFSNLC